MAGTILTPGGTTGWNFQRWKRTVEATTYEKMKFIKSIEDEGRPYSQLNIRKHARVSGTQLAQSAEGTGLTYLNIIGSSVTITPVGSVVPVAWSEDEDAQIDLNLDAEGKSNIEGALSEFTETNVLANIQTLTQTMSQASVDGPMFRQAYGRLMGNTNGLATPGEGEQVYAVFSHTQYPNLGTIPEFNAADVRGGSETPYVKGIWMKGGGVILILTSVAASDANGFHNAMYLASAFATGWNVRTRLKRQDEELQNRLILYNNMGSAVKHNARAIAMRTTASAL